MSGHEDSWWCIRSKRKTNPNGVHVPNNLPLKGISAYLCDPKEEVFPPISIRRGLYCARRDWKENSTSEMRSRQLDSETWVVRDRYALLSYLTEIMEQYNG